MVMLHSSRGCMRAGMSDEVGLALVRAGQVGVTGDVPHEALGEHRPALLVAVRRARCVELPGCQQVASLHLSHVRHDPRPGPALQRLLEAGPPGASTRPTRQRHGSGPAQAEAASSSAAWRSVPRHHGDVGEAGDLVDDHPQPGGVVAGVLPGRAEVRLEAASGARATGPRPARG